MVPHHPFPPPGMAFSLHLFVHTVFAGQNLNMNLKSDSVEGSSELYLHPCPRARRNPEPCNPSDAQCLVHSEHRISKECWERRTWGSHENTVQLCPARAPRALKAVIGRAPKVWYVSNPCGFGAHLFSLSKKKPCALLLTGT